MLRSSPVSKASDTSTSTFRVRDGRQRGRTDETGAAAGTGTVVSFVVRLGSMASLRAQLQGAHVHGHIHVVPRARRAEWKRSGTDRAGWQRAVGTGTSHSHAGCCLEVPSSTGTGRAIGTTIRTEIEVAPSQDRPLTRALAHIYDSYIYIPRVRVNANDGRFVVVRALDPPPPPRISNSGFLSSKFSLGSHSLESPPRVDHHITTVDRDLYARRHPWRRTPRSRLSPSDPPSNLFPSSPLTQSPKRPCRTAG